MSDFPEKLCIRLWKSGGRYFLTDKKLLSLRSLNMFWADQFFDDERSLH